jgi:hypothetical protein
MDEKYRDNCYAEPKPLIDESMVKKPIHQRKKKLVNRRTQTYLRELLWLDGEDQMEADQVVMMEEDCELDNLFT